MTTVTVAAARHRVSFEYVAQTQSSQSVNIQARVSGFLDKRVYTEGDVVRAGQVLFLMDPKPLQAQVDAAQARCNNIQAALDVAKFNLDRTKPLTEQNAMSQKDLDDANGQYLTSKANVDQARANLESAQLNLSYATITSPITGVTGSAIVADGTYVSTQQQPADDGLGAVADVGDVQPVGEPSALRYRDDIERGLLKRPPGGQLHGRDRDGRRHRCFPRPAASRSPIPRYNSQTGTFTVRVHGRQSAGPAATEPVRACAAQGRGAAERAWRCRCARCSRAPRDISSGWSARTTRSRCGR